MLPPTVLTDRFKGCFSTAFAVPLHYFYIIAFIIGFVKGKFISKVLTYHVLPAPDLSHARNFSIYSLFGVMTFISISGFCSAYA